ncbi:type II toxin-antitoxin system Phd/YefM family antitoxin [Variovorax ginsengisoli]|uniref:Type II toxin-antitoxin system Phd/YefM family antitoxin n=1 Tax=Variovorax ginsengisoli TaxID=363844 RepID=A0ABT8S7H6_9BURK|nr:type II toxin-antitoxin system Phd/YefM family antitoxin [Variovorax ginsengisoli]MDN8615253.1 type II toxin-antitoxin system Phd/YefM family antitoxin [Variovorax ginsengisoli]MDO1534423.1 type II toxin-antitoxin system Phd/YefM family antitoxin [Variovorax ginsengisoli]
MSQAKSGLSRLVDDVAQGREREIVIVRGGRPVAKLVPFEDDLKGKRIGVAKGKFQAPDSIDSCDEELPALFRGD